ncbi:MAG: beta-ketoacyl-ACP synthase III [Plesiomonas sp.]|uniref:beta-ketoacyl-ACP synthase III n=1 Tax=Plesiomonas sp. TaxID=2486279 RepID=UPI003F366AB1
MQQIVISGSGLYIPPHQITNVELVNTFNQYVAHYNAKNHVAITTGQIVPLQMSSTEFIEKASGIKQRYVVACEGILNPDIMHPLLPELSDDQPSVMAQMAVIAAKEALLSANHDAADIDLVIVAASNLQRAYPAIAIEVQALLGAKGYAFDMNVACSSATFAISQAVDAINSGMANTVLIVNPEVCSGHANFCDRDSHFIFGDACSALVLEKAENSQSRKAFQIIDRTLHTHFSNNIRNNFGFLNRATPETQFNRDKLFMQEGRKVFKEVLPLVSQLLEQQVERVGLESHQLKRLWLHQANSNMNAFLARKVLGRDPLPLDAPTILHEFANTSSAGSIIAFHRYHDDFSVGDYGVLCAFGAGYSVGSILLQCVR